MLTSRNVENCRMHASQGFTIRPKPGQYGVHSGLVALEGVVDLKTAKGTAKNDRKASKNQRKRRAAKSLAHHCATR